MGTLGGRRRGDDWDAGLAFGGLRFSLFLGVVLVFWLQLGCREAAPPSQRIARALASVNLDSGLRLGDSYSAQYPSPYVFVTRLAQLGLSYHPSIIEMHPISQVSDDAAGCAIQLGILSARYAYAVYHDDLLQSEEYLGKLLFCISRLGLGEILEDDHLKRMQSTWHSGADVLPTIMELLVRANHALHKEGRSHAYALVAASTWAESTRMLLELSAFSDGQGLYRLISEQRYTQSVVLEHLSGFVYNDDTTLSLYNHVESMSELLHSIPVTYEYEGTSIDTVERLCRISSRMHVSLTQGRLRALRRQANALIAWASSKELKANGGR